MKTEARPKLVVLCGSTRFRDEILAVGRAEALAGAIVLGPWSFERELDEATAQLLVVAHRYMIEMADEVLVVAPGGYVGSSTQEEIDLALDLGRRVRYVNPWER